MLPSSLKRRSFNLFEANIILLGTSQREESHVGKSFERIMDPVYIELPTDTKESGLETKNFSTDTNKTMDAFYVADSLF